MNKIELINVFFSLFILLVSSNYLCAQGPPPPAIKAGLEITRTKINKIVKEIDSSLIFRQEKDINGSPNYLATNTHNTLVQLIGEEKELKSAVWEFNFTTDIAFNKQNVMNMCYFMYFLGKEKGRIWITEQLTSVSKDYKADYISEKKILDYNRTAQFIYYPKQKMMRLIFTEW